MLNPRIRLYIPQPLAEGALLALEAGQSHYLSQVMRLREGAQVAVFNGQDGLWRADVAQLSKKQVGLRLLECIMPQRAGPDVWLAFVPIKNKTDIVVEKAVELGAGKLLVAYSQHAVVKSVNHEKLRQHAIEAAEQCERLDVPAIEEHKDLSHLLGAWPRDRILLYADESGGGESLKQVLSSMTSNVFGVLVGPEGGFSAEEHHMLKLLPQVKPFGMGPRILRADTAAVAALACVQAWVGDWDERPRFVPAE
jgi:16S rRNA (uracil1498-N3)-methyltransferase